ncbi:MAG: thioredoxin domain-containing protein [Candidatus Hydrothermarchaeota archaeon]
MRDNLIFVVLISILVFMGVFTYLNLESSGKYEDYERKIVYDYTPEKLHMALTSGKPTLLEIAADWCPYCREMAPTMNTIKEKYKSEFNIITANADLDLDLVRYYQVKGLPTLVFFDREGKEVFKLVGFQEKEKLEKIIEELIQK